MSWGYWEEWVLYYSMCSKSPNIYYFESITGIIPKQLCLQNCTIFMIYYLPQCANNWLNFQSREMTLLRGKLSHIRLLDSPWFGSTSLMLILTGHEYWLKATSHANQSKLPKMAIDISHLWQSMADHSGFKFIAYVLTILWHIYSSLINMRCLSFQIFKVCKTIVDVHICNGQLKIYGPFIFNWTVGTSFSNSY